MGDGAPGEAVRDRGRRGRRGPFLRHHRAGKYEDARGLSLVFPETQSSTGGDIYSEAEPYDWEAPFNEEGLDRITKKVAVEPAGTKGWHLNRRIAILVERLGSDEQILTYFTSTMKHEVQHAADLSEEEVAGLGERTAKNLLAHAKVDFATEYRAHNIMGLPEIERTSATKIVPFSYTGTHKVSERHDAVCRKAWNDIRFKYVSADTSKPSLSKSELSELYVYMAETDPMGKALNILNSVRIDTFYQALAKWAPARVAAAFADLLPAEVWYLENEPGPKERIEAAVAKGIGPWRAVPEFWRGLERIDQLVSAASGLAQMYDWSFDSVVERALRGELDHLLDRRSRADVSYIA